MLCIWALVLFDFGQTVIGLLVVKIADAALIVLVVVGCLARQPVQYTARTIHFSVCVRVCAKHTRTFHLICFAGAATVAVVVVVARCWRSVNKCRKFIRL